MATIFDVAARAGVGVGTVSRVLNRSPLVSDATRTKVLGVIEDLDYRPSSLARGLSLGRTNTIGIAVPFFTSPSTVQRMRGFAQVLAGTDYQFMVLNIENEQQRSSALRAVTGDQVDGAVIVSLVPSEQELRRLRPGRTVFIDVQVPGFSSVYSDDRVGGEMATRHLLELGHRRIGFVGDSEDMGVSSASARRRRGYEDALAKAGIEPLPVRLGPPGRSSARSLTEEMLADGDRPTAIFAAYDTQALGVIEAARSRGLAIPDDLSVIGFDDIEMAAHVGLSTIHQPLESSGERAAQILLGLLADPATVPEHEVQGLQLKARNTTGVRGNG